MFDDWFKINVHKHKYVTLDAYPPRTKMFENEYSFLLRCNCGHTKLTNLPRTITMVREVHTDGLLNKE